MPNRLLPPACWSTAKQRIRHSPGFGIATKIVRRNPIQTTLRGPGLYDAQITFGLNPPVPIRLALLIARKTGPVEIPAAVNQRSTATLTQIGTARFGRDRLCRRDRR
jgi:hypothetical protein